MSGNQHRVVSVALTEREYWTLTQVAESRGLQSVDELIRDNLARTLAAARKSTDPVIRMVLEGFDDGRISVALDMTRQAVQRRRRRAGLKSNSPFAVDTRKEAAS